MSSLGRERLVDLPVDGVEGVKPLRFAEFARGF
jgi:hypothetical protein